MQLKNSKIYLTGADGGLGVILQEYLQNEGAIIQPHLKDNGDLSTQEGIEKAANIVREYKPNILINLAGLQYFGEIEKQNFNDIFALLNVNLLSPIALTQAVLPNMRAKKQGHIVNIGSIFGSINFAYFSTYSASKAGLQGFSESLRREVAEDNISISYIAPRAIKTKMSGGKIAKLAEKTSMKLDEPTKVVSIIINAIKNNKKDVYIGFPEAFFVRMNAIFPRIVDGSLAKNDKIAKSILTKE